MWLFKNQYQENPQQNPWLAYYKPNPKVRLRLFCFHYAGGSASAYRSWANRLPEWVELLPVQLPGREGRISETPINTVSELVNALRSALKPYLTPYPFALFGHSMGGLIAYELARSLELSGESQPSLLMVSSYPAPQIHLDEYKIAGLPEESFLFELNRRFNTIPDSMRQNQELIDLLMPMLRADFSLTENYRYNPGKPLTCPVMVYGGTDDPEIKESDLTPWELQTTGTFNLRLFRGDHFYFQKSSENLLSDISSQLYQVRLTNI
jgi:medium-chain acyl-[acyl-carrier-protein] hydrolase